MEIRKMLLFLKLFSVSIENRPCYPNKEKMYKLLLVAVIYPPIVPNEHINIIQ